MECSMPGFPVLHHLLEFAQTHVHWVHDVIQPSHALSPPSPPVLNFSHHPGLFRWVASGDLASGVQSIRASASVLPVNIQGWFPLGLIWSLCSPRDSSSIFSNTAAQKHQFFSVQPSLQSNSHIHTWLLEKPFLWLYVTIYVGKVMSPLFNTLLRFVITFLPRSKHHLISWLQSPSAVILESKKVVSHCLHCFSTYLPWSDRNGWHDLCFLNVEF